MYRFEGIRKCCGMPMESFLFLLSPACLLVGKGSGVEAVVLFLWYILDELQEKCLFMVTQSEHFVNISLGVVAFWRCVVRKLSLALYYWSLEQPYKKKDIMCFVYGNVDFFHVLEMLHPRYRKKIQGVPILLLYCTSWAQKDFYLHTSTLFNCFYISCSGTWLIKREEISTRFLWCIFPRVGRKSELDEMTRDSCMKYEWAREKNGKFRKWGDRQSYFVCLCSEHAWISLRLSVWVFFYK